MEFKAAADGDRITVTTNDGRLFVFPIHELQATRRRPRRPSNAPDLPVSTPLQTLEAARAAAEEFAIIHDLI